MNQTTGQREAAEYMNHLKGGVYPIMVGGHSKGGNFAVYAAAYCDPEIRDMITDVYNNDGPGFTKAITEGEEYGKIRDRIHTFIPESSLVGVLMNSGVEMRIIKSDEKGVAQHDALSWQVMRDHFIESDSRTSESLVFDEAVRSWLSELDDQDRHLFIENVFDVFEETGYETVDDMNANWYKSYPQIIKSLRELPKERQMEITRILLQLAQHYGQAYMNSLSHKEASQDVQKWAREWALKNGKRAIEKRLRDKSGRR